MPWVKVDDSFPDHPKARAAGVAGRDLFLKSLCYSAKYLTDGFIPTAVVSDWIKGFCRHESDAVSRLLHPPPGFSHGLWEEVEGGYRIHDYLDYAPSKEQVRAERRAAKERQDRYREKSSGRFGNAEPTRDQRRDERGSNGVTNGVTDALRTPTHSRPVPSYPVHTLSPTPSPPGPTVTGEIDISGDQAGGPETESREHEFFAAYRRKSRELMDEFGSANFHERRVQELLAAWERDWREAHGLPPRNLEESA
jgi:hypothetical protein